MMFLVKTFNELTNIELYEILKARCAVFTVEQKMNCQDLDGIDYKSYHCFLYNGEQVVGYLRAYFTDYDNKIMQLGRCLTTVRGEGWGRELMNNALWHLQFTYGVNKFVLHAQKNAVDFYGKFDFTVCSDEFMEEGIPHYLMERQ